MASGALVERVPGTAVMRFEIDVATGYYDMRDPPPYDADAFFSVHHPSHEPDEPPPAPRNLLLEEGEDANAGPIRRRGSGGVGSEGDVSDGHEAADEKRSPDLFSRLAAGEKRRQQPKTPEVRKETVPRQAAAPRDPPAGGPSARIRLRTRRHRIRRRSPPRSSARRPGGRRWLAVTVEQVAPAGVWRR